MTDNRMQQYIICISVWTIKEGGVVVPDSTSPGFVRIWDRDGSGPRFVPSQDSPLLLTYAVSVSNTSSIEIILLSRTS